MADAVARREARRQRILQNSDNRLQRIIGGHDTNVGATPNGKPPAVQESGSTSVDPTADIRFRLDPMNRTSRRNVRDKTSSHVIKAEINHQTTNHETKYLDEPRFESQVSLDHLRESSIRCDESTVSSPSFVRNRTNGTVSQAGESSSAPTLAASRFVPGNDVQEQVDTVARNRSAWHRALQSIWLPVLLAVLMNALYFFHLEYFLGKSILVPFFCLILARLRFDDSSDESSSGSLLSAALLLSNIKHDLIKKFRWFMRILSKVSEEFAIYMFSFVFIYNILASYQNDLDVTISTIDLDTNPKV